MSAQVTLPERKIPGTRAYRVSVKTSPFFSCEPRPPDTPSGVVPAGDGHSAQKNAFPVRPAEFPNGPNDPLGRPRSVDCRIAARADGGVSGVQGNCPSAQFVAAYRPKLRSSALSSLAPRS